MQNSVSEDDNSQYVSEGGSAPAASNNAAPTFSSYDEVFPALSTPTAMPQPQKAWTNKLRVGSSTVTQHFVIPREERKFDNEKFGEKDSLKICQQIMKETKTTIEVSAGKDQGLTFLVSGKVCDVNEAQRRIINYFQSPSQATVEIPKEFHRKLVGKGGQRMKDLEAATSCKISVPSINDISDIITITGPRTGLEKALHEIHTTYDKLSKQASERVQVPKIYYPFIVGAHNENINKLQADLGVRIAIPPPSVLSDEISIAGTREGVQAAKDAILSIVRTMEGKCKQVSVEVPKAQHKYIIGPKKSTLAEILQQTGVAVEIPAADDMTDTITLRGPQEKLGQAMTMVFAKATSYKIVTIDAPRWLHKRLRGKKGDNIKRIVGEDSRFRVEFKEEEGTIRIEGPSEEIDRVKKEFEREIAEYLKTLVYEEFRVNPKFFKHIIGKQGANVNRLKEETGAEINITEEGEIQIEGSPEGVAKVKSEVQDMVRKLENEREVDVNVDVRLIRTLGRIRELRDAFPQVMILLPPPGEKGEVKLRGPSEDCDRCVQTLKKLARELAEEYSSVQVPIFKQFHKFVIGKGGINIRKIREETGTTIKLPNEGDTSDVIWITGRQDAVKQAKERIQRIQDEMANIVTREITIPPKFYNTLIGSGGKLIQAISAECGNVLIKFPDPDSNSDRVTISGPKDDVERAVKQLEEQKNEKLAASFTAQVKAKPQHHKYIIGKNGGTVKKIRDSTGARIIFPSERDPDPETIVIMGKQDQVEKAKKELEEIVASINNMVEDEMTVDRKHHKHFITKRGAVIQQISDECGGVTISFPRLNDSSDKVVLKGPKECIELAKQKILEHVKEQESMRDIKCEIPKKHHRVVMGVKGTKVQQITLDYDVMIKFPDRDLPGTEELKDGEKPVNGEGEPEEPKPGDLITITGLPENCERAKQALLDLVPITSELSVPYEFHRRIIGKSGSSLRDLMDRNDVRITMSPQDNPEDIIRVTGAPVCVENAKKAILDRVEEIKVEQEERALRSYEIKLEIDPEYHPKIIGKGGKVISKIREDYDVMVNLPKRGEPNDEVITITGYEDKVLAAKEHILSIVNELKGRITVEVEIDSSVHGSLIGNKGRNVRRLMTDYNVDVKFPRRTDSNPNLVVISGTNEEDVENAKDVLLAQADERMESQPIVSKSKPDGFVVTGAPWETGPRETPNMSSTQDFPSFGMPSQTANGPAVAAWGPRR